MISTKSEILLTLELLLRGPKERLACRERLANNSYSLYSPLRDINTIKMFEDLKSKYEEKK